ncbi:MAG TPA: helix-turn-helix domain-containing protein [candidate division Zixibacteria bacterium]|nr:helix-turn-helix domain-containing protein [candidate division Zixibacteria bacterium]
MSGRDRLLIIGRRRGERAYEEWAEAVRELRLGLGLSRAALALALGISPSKLQRWEHAQAPRPDVVEASMVMRLLGHDLRLNWFPVGGQARDAGHLRLVRAFLGLLPPELPRRIEASLGIPGDLRAWDVLLTVGSRMIGVAAETRLRDWQALLRREHAKLRDSGADRLLLVLWDSKSNREVVTLAGPALRQALPLDGRSVLAALRARRDPGGDGLLFLRPPRLVAQ